MQTKICSQCHLEKPIEEFSLRNSKTGSYRAHCKKCHSAYASNRYKENKKILDKTKENKSCARCGYNECLEALDYHHIDPKTKKETVAVLLTHYNVSDGLKEIKKCILLCANCHRYFHYLEKKEYITLKEFLKR